MSIVGLEALTIEMVASLANHYTKITYKNSINKKYFTNTYIFTNGIFVLTKDNTYYLQHVGF